MKTTINKSQVMKRAWVIAKCIARRTGSKVITASFTFREAMRQAWKEAKAAIKKAIREAEYAEITPRSISTADLSFMAGCANLYRDARPGQYFGD